MTTINRVYNLPRIVTLIIRTPSKRGLEIRFEALYKIPKANVSKGKTGHSF